MLILVCYDVSTESEGGKRRLRRVAKACKDYGQRVQKSVFECQLNEILFEQLERQLLGIIDKSSDNLRFYRLVEPVDKYRKEYGVFKALDFEGPLIV